MGRAMREGHNRRGGDEIKRRGSTERRNGANKERKGKEKVASQ